MTRSDQTPSSSNTRVLSKALVFHRSDIPFEGVDVATSEGFEFLYKPEERPMVEHDNLKEVFTAPIDIKASIVPVGSKMDLRGEFSTKAEGVCDRCARPMNYKIDGNFSTFLMPRQQFSEHDKPGGKVIHPPTRGQKPSRHHSKSKAPVLTEAEGEHEDLHFGAYNGEQIDLRPLIREYLILQIPMHLLCTENCQGLCLGCGENLNDSKCRCQEGPKRVLPDDVKTPETSALADALKAKLTPR